jgi:hypothetical protein
MARKQDIVGNLDGEQIVIELYVKNADGTPMTDATDVSFVLADKAGGATLLELNSSPHVLVTTPAEGYWTIILGYTAHLASLSPDKSYYYSIWSSQDSKANWKAQVSGFFRLILATKPA